jgi:ubiquinone/menaquinone biosynthesis C-methylase UbiE
MTEARADLYAKGKKISPEAAIHLADLLERLGQHPSQVKIRQEFIRGIGIRRGDRILDVGSGTGVLTRDLSPFSGEMGHVIGVDPNYRLVESARKLAKEKGLSGKVSFCMGEGEVINFSADNAYPVTAASQLFSHVEDSEKILYEMIRVTKPGGRIAVLEYDFSTYNATHPDRENTDRLVRFALDHYIFNPAAVRTLPTLFNELGLEQVEVHGLSHSETEAEGPITLYFQEALRTAVARGTISPETASTWREGLLKAAAEGGFQASLSYTALFGLKPNV